MDPGSTVDLGDVDFALIPGVAFDVRGGVWSTGQGTMIRCREVPTSVHH